jgi:hypothetical protein
MGAFSTLNITRSKAIEFLTREIVQASDETLADMLDAALYDRLYNVRIVSGWDEETDDHVL